MRKTSILALAFLWFDMAIAAQTAVALASTSPADGIRLAQRGLASAPVLQRTLSSAGLGKECETRLIRIKGPYPLVAEETLRETTIPGATAGGRILEYHSVVADHLIVQLRQGHGEEDLAEACVSRGWSIRKALPIPGFYLVAIDQPGIEGLRSAAADFMTTEDALFETVESDELIWADAIPNDPDFGLLYGMNNTGQFGGTAGADIDASEAWDHTTGSTNVIVAVIDSGIDLDHPDLAGNLWTNPGETGWDANGNDKRTNGIDDDGDGYIDDYRGWDFYNSDNNPDDDYGHGTHCSGTIGAVGNNGIGVAGVCWKTRIMPLKFLGASGSGPSSAAASAIYYAVAHGAKVLSCSWGSTSYNSALAAAISKADDQALLVAAAGNDGTDNDATPHYPSSYGNTNILSVAANDWNDNLAYFSNFGATSVDLSAPGYYTYSTVTNGLYGYKSGTSMATPHVSGAAALLWSLLPSASVARIRDAILSSIDPVASQAGKTATGGRLNVNAALSSLTFSVTGSDPAANSATSAPPTSVTLTFSDPVLTTSLQPAGLTVNGIAATEAVAIGERSVRYIFAAVPVTTEGVQTVSLAPGALTRAGDGASVQAFFAKFYYDVTTLKVANIVPAAGTLTTIPTTLRFSFNEPIDPGSVSTSNVTLSVGTVVSATVISTTAVIYGISLPALDGKWTVTLNAGALTDRNGCPGASYQVAYTVDLPVADFPHAWQPFAPLGTQVYTNTVQGQISAADDSDSYWLRLDATQLVSVVVLPDSTLKPNIRVESASGTVLSESTASAIGGASVLSGVRVPGGETCILKVSGADSSSGSYTLNAVLSATLEQEPYGSGNNGTAATAVNLDTAWQVWSGTGAARKVSVIGGLASASTLKLYTVDFATPPHTLGARPALGFDSMPRKTLSAVWFGSPTVSSSVGPISSQCLNLGAGGQVQTSVGTYGSFSTDYSTYRLAFDAVIMPTVDGLTLLCDCPTVRNINFKADTSIQLWASPYTFSIGTFTPGQAFHMEVLLNRAADTLSVWKDGTLLATKSGNGLGAITSFRFSTLYETNTVGLDNIVISTDDAVSTGSDEDWYKLTCTGTAPVSVALSAVNVVTPITVQVLGTDGTTVLSSGLCANGTTTVLSGITPPQGTVYLRVQGQATSYNLSAMENICLECEPNATRARATATGAATVLATRVGGDDAQDWFACSLTTNTPVRFSSETPGDGAFAPDNTLVPILAMYDSAGTFLTAAAANASDGRNAILSYQPQVSGTYYILLSALSGSGDILISRSTASSLGLWLETNEVTEGAADLISGEIRLSAPSSTPISVSLLSDDTHRLTVPASVTVPAGATNATFQAQVIDEDRLDGLATVTITARAAGYLDTSAAMRVHDNDKTTLSLVMPDSISEGAGCVTNAGRLVLGRIADTDLTATLSSSDTSGLVVPPTLVIPAGASEATFPIDAIDDVLYDDLQTVTVTALIADIGSAQASITVWDDERQDIRLEPTSSLVREDAGTIANAGHVIIGHAVSRDIKVWFSSSLPADLAPAADWITLPAGTTNATFGIRVGDDARRQGRRTVQLTAALSNGESTNAAFTVLDNDPDHLQFDAVGNVQTSEIPFSVGVSYQTVDGDATPKLAAHNVTLGTKVADGTATLCSPAEITLTNGVWQGEVALLGRCASCRLTAADDEGRACESASFSLLAPMLDIEPKDFSNVPVAYGTATQRELVITNIGAGSLQFHFDSPQPDWIGMSATNGSVAARASVTIQLSLNAAGLQRNEHLSTTLVLRSNDLEAPSNSIPVSITVLGPDLQASATAPTTALEMGQSFIFQYAVTNAGTTNASFSIASFYLSKDANLSNDDISFAYLDYVPPLTAGAQSQRSTYLELPDAAYGWAPNAFLLVQVDSLEFVDEGVCETNNVYAVPVALTRASSALVLLPAAATNVTVSAGLVLLKTFCVSNAGQQKLEFALKGLPSFGSFGAGSPTAECSSTCFWSMGVTTSSVEPSATTQLYVLFDARTCAPGFYGSAEPVLTSNDPLYPAVSLPLSMGVPAGPPVMTAESAITLGASNEVSWTSSDGAARYECECLPLSNSRCLENGTLHVFAPLADGVFYSYRARAITDFTFGSATSDWSTATGSLQLAPFSDYDGDGIPNVWEINHGLCPTNRLDAAKDFDHDGLSNFDEYQTGTDPTNRQSRLCFVNVVQEARGFRFTWRGGTEAYQVLESSTSLNANAEWAACFTNRPPTAVTNSYFLPIPNTATESRFMRVRAFR